MICALLLTVALSGAVAHGITPEQCQAELMRRTGRYYECRLEESARALEVGDVPQYDACKRALYYRWRRYGLGCFGVPQGAFEQLLVEDVDAIEALIRERAGRR